MSVDKKDIKTKQESGKKIMKPDYTNNKTATSTKIGKSIIKPSYQLSQHRKSHVKFVVKGIFFLYLFVMALFIGYHLVYAKSVIPGVKVNGLKVGGLTTEESVNYLSSSLIPPKKIVLSINSGNFEIKPDDISFRYLPIETTKIAFGIGRQNNLFLSLKDKVSYLFNNEQISPVYDYDEYALREKINEIRRQSVGEVKESSYKFEAGELVIIPGAEGLSFDELQVSNDILKSFQENNPNAIFVETQKKSPRLTVEDLDMLKPKFEDILAKKYLLKYEDLEWEITPDVLLKIIIPQKADAGSVLALDEYEVINEIERVAQKFNRNPRGQVLEIQNGKAVKFVSSEEGLKVKVKETAELLMGSLSGQITSTSEGESVEIPIAMQISTPPQNDNEFNIEDLLGTGESKFKGSIPSRVHNIGLAASKVNGTVVAPGESFSFNESVGGIDRANGFEPAYVISGGRTVLGDGGGVCQVSTTVFRAALDAGFPIEERHAHSYRVSYYEQESDPGIDATIFSPTADLRFKNDTDGYLLVTSEFSDKDYSLKFKIYGKSDGREVEMSKPKILSRSSAPPTVYEQDPNLPKGKTIQVEHAVSGATVSFDRVVKRDGEVLYSDTFKSVYRPWAAVYKVGTKE